jgi:hypothetical protein
VAIGTVLGIVAGFVVGWLVFRVICAWRGRVGGNEEEGKREGPAGVSSGGDAVAVPAPPEDALDSGSGSDGGNAPEPEPATELSGSGRGDSSPAAKGEDSSGGGSSPFAPEADSGAGSGKLVAVPPAKPVKAIGVGGAPDGEDIEIEVIEGECVRIVSTVGGRATVPVPFKKQLWSRRHFRAHFKPEVKGLWLSTEKGSIEPGARECPFALFFGPEEAGSFETTLIVSFGEFETHVPIVASTEGGARRHRHHHAE